jgi:hypothetical protein
MSTVIPEDYKALLEAEANLRNVHDLISHAEFVGHEATKVHLALAFVKSNHDDIVSQINSHPYFVAQQEANEDGHE